jgi:hypothetical protein
VEISTIIIKEANKVNVKKLSVALLASSLVFPVLFQTPVDAAPKKQVPITININGDRLPTDVDPITINGRVMLPFRAILEELGATVDWQSKQRKITAYKDGVQIVLNLNSKVATINNTKVSLDAAPIGYKGRTMVPVRFVSEALGQYVDWQASTRTVTILSIDQPGGNNNTPPPSNNVINPVRNISLSDIADYGDGRDLRVSFSKSTTESLVQSYNVYIVKATSANNFNIASSTRATSAGNYTNILATGKDPSVVLNSGAKDVDGDLIRNGQSYVAYVLAVGKGNISNVLSSSSSQLTLTNGRSVDVATNVAMSDVADYGDGRDLSVSFTRPKTDSNIANYRVFIVKTNESNNFTLAKAVGASSQYYTNVNKSTSSSIKVNLSSSARDTSGDLIRNGVSYTAFVLSVSNNTNLLDHKLSSPSSSLVLNQGTLTAPTISKVEDIADNGDGRDLRVSFNKVSDESRISGYRIFVVKNSKQASFNLSQANYVSSANYTSVNKTNYNITQTLSYNTTDVDGDFIRNNISYRVFVMAVGTGSYNGTNTLSNASSTITLSTNGVVEPVWGLNVSDVADNGNGSDLQVSFTRASNESNVSEYRVFVVPNNYGYFDLRQANSLNSNYYTRISKRGTNISQVLSSSSRDVRGNLIKNDEDYKVYVMTVKTSNTSGDNALSNASSVIRLANNSTVGAVSYVNVADVADHGNGRDLHVSFSPINNESNLSNYQVYVVKASKANSFNLTQANNNRYYTAFSKNGVGISKPLNADTRDTDGQEVQNNVEYKVFVLSVSNKGSANNALSNPSQPITLVDGSAVQAVGNLNAFTIGNTGTFADIKVSFTRPSDESNISEYRILVIPSADAKNFSLEDANGLNNRNYTSVAAGSNTNEIPLQSEKDVNGTTLHQNTSYKIKVLTVAKNGKKDVLSGSSGQVDILPAPAPAPEQVSAATINLKSTTDKTIEVMINPPSVSTNIDYYTVIAVPTNETQPGSVEQAMNAKINKKVSLNEVNTVVTLGGDNTTLDTKENKYNIYVISNTLKEKVKSTLSSPGLTAP